MAVTLAQASAALALYREAVPAAVLRGLRRGMRIAEGLTKTVFMERGDNRYRDPANPPPGPLKIRSGDLVRTVKIADLGFDGKNVTGGLQAGNGQIRYARIHELGGLAGRGRKVLIRPRPYLRPAIEQALPQINDSIKLELARLARATLRGMARVS